MPQKRSPATLNDQMRPPERAPQQHRDVASWGAASVDSLGVQQIESLSLVRLSASAPGHPVHHQLAHVHPVTTTAPAMAAVSGPRPAAACG